MHPAELEVGERGPSVFSDNGEDPMKSGKHWSDVVCASRATSSYVMPTVRIQSSYAYHIRSSHRGMKEKRDRPGMASMKILWQKHGLE